MQSVRTGLLGVPDEGSADRTSDARGFPPGLPSGSRHSPQRKVSTCWPEHPAARVSEGGSTSPWKEAKARSRSDTSSPEKTPAKASGMEVVHSKPADGVDAQDDAQDSGAATCIAELEANLLRERCQVATLQELLHKMEQAMNATEKDADGRVRIKELEVKAEHKAKTDKLLHVLERQNELIKELRKKAADSQKEWQKFLGSLKQKDRQIRELEDRLETALPSHAAVLGPVAEDDGDGPEVELRQEQRRLAEEVAKREVLQGQPAEEQRARVAGRSVGQDIDRERELCDFQQQLAEELKKRREVQNDNIEKERALQAKDCQIRDLHNHLAHYQKPLNLRLPTVEMAPFDDRSSAPKDKDALSESSAAPPAHEPEGGGAVVWRVVIGPHPSPSPGPRPRRLRAPSPALAGQGPGAPAMVQAAFSYSREDTNSHAPPGTTGPTASYAAPPQGLSAAGLLCEGAPTSQHALLQNGYPINSVKIRSRAYWQVQGALPVGTGLNPINPSNANPNLSNQLATAWRTLA